MHEFSRRLLKLVSAQPEVAIHEIADTKPFPRGPRSTERPDAPSAASRGSERLRSGAATLAREDERASYVTRPLLPLIAQSRSAALHGSDTGAHHHTAVAPRAKQQLSNSADGGLASLLSDPRK